MARWLPLMAWSSCATALILIVMVNLAGTQLLTLGHQHHYQDSILAGGLGPFSVALPFHELESSGASYINYTLHMYVNAACITPLTLRDADDGPACLYRGVGRTFNLSALVEFAGPSPGYGYPNATLVNVHMTPLRMTVVPFIFYLIGLIALAVLVVSIPLVFCAEHFALHFHLALAAGAFLAIMVASAILTGLVNARIHELHHNSSAAYIADAKVPAGFAGASWGAACAALFAGALLLLDWHYEVKLSALRGLRGLVRVRKRTVRSRTVVRTDQGDTFRFGELRSQQSPST